MDKRNVILPVFVPHFGCPHTCAFCNQWKISGQKDILDSDSFFNQIKNYASLVKNKKQAFIEVAFYGGSFTGIDVSVQEDLLVRANEAIKLGLVHSIRLSTRPDYISEQVIDMLKQYNVSTVELGVQSMNEKVLDSSNRGHSVSDVYNAVRLLKKANISVGIQLMPGLPEDTKEISIATALEVANLRPSFVRIYPTLVLKNTDLEFMYKKGNYNPWSLEKAVEVCKEQSIIFAKEKIPVIRIGLQASANLSFEKDLVAGPYHPSMGELVEGAVFLEQIKVLLGYYPMPLDEKKVVLLCNPRDVSKVIGLNKVNLKIISEVFNINLKILQRNDLDLSTIALGDNKSKITALITREDFLKNYRIN